MSTEHLDGLLEQLNSGDAVAAEQVFHTFGPYLHMLVRRQLATPLRAKFDSMDVVQSVWADLLEGLQGAGWRFSDRAHLQAFLIRLTRNRFIDRCRKHRTALQREEPLSWDSSDLGLASPEPGPSEVARGNELWDLMVTLCPPAHRALLQMKREGIPLAEIAHRTGLHPSSVRRILYDLARRVGEVREKAATANPAD